METFKIKGKEIPKQIVMIESVYVSWSILFGQVLDLRLDDEDEKKSNV